MSDTMMFLALLVLVSLVALGLGFVALVLRGGAMSLRVKAPGAELKSRVETERATDHDRNPPVLVERSLSQGPSENQ